MILSPRASGATWSAGNYQAALKVMVSLSSEPVVCVFAWVWCFEDISNGCKGGNNSV